MKTMELPMADSTPLASAPLELVVCQVRYDETFSASEGRVILEVHKDLGGRAGRFEKAESVKTSSVELTLGGADSSSTLSGWRLVSNDGAWTATVMPNALSLETIAYVSWDDVRPLLEAVVASVGKHVAPTIVQRLGLRYVNRLVLADVRSAVDWQPYVDPALLGPIGHSVLGRAVHNTMQQVDLDLGSGISATLRHGSMNDASLKTNTAYLLDFDVFHQTPMAFEVGPIMEYADTFNDLALRLFHQTVTPALIRQLRKGDESVAK
jgi:uncharacterized protein (TIGR04255 family)